MKIVGLTGGIGSGKTTVAKMFSDLGVPVYNSDIEAKKLANSSDTIREGLISLLGKEIYKDGTLDRKQMAGYIFRDSILLNKVNALIHPEVAQHFKHWVTLQKFPYVLKEAAILYESGSYKQCDQVIMVTAPTEERMLRVMNRDHISRKEVEARMKNQWSDTKKMELADFIIHNMTLPNTQKRVETLHYQLIQGD